MDLDIRKLNDKSSTLPEEWIWKEAHRAGKYMSRRLTVARAYRSPLFALHDVVDKLPNQLNLHL